MTSIPEVNKSLIQNAAFSISQLSICSGATCAPAPTDHLPICVVPNTSHCNLPACPKLHSRPLPSSAVHLSSIPGPPPLPSPGPLIYSWLFLFLFIFYFYVYVLGSVGRVCVCVCVLSWRTLCVFFILSPFG